MSLKNLKFFFQVFIFPFFLGSIIAALALSLSKNETVSVFAQNNEQTSFEYASIDDDFVNFDFAIKSKEVNFDLVNNFEKKPSVSFANSYNQPNLSIPIIGLKNVSLDYGSNNHIQDLDKKLLNGPVVENQLTSELCTEGENSYIYGHSEPVGSVFGNGSDVFADLNKLKAGDIITVVNENKQKCSYKVKSWESVYTDINQIITSEDFNRIFNPQDVGNGLLTIQTCKKGSLHERLILRAELI